MIEEIVEERLVLLEMLGTTYRLYLRCGKCRGVFLHQQGHAPAYATVICPSCFSSAPASGYSKAIGVMGDETEDEVEALS